MVPQKHDTTSVISNIFHDNTLDYLADQRKKNEGINHNMEYFEKKLGDEKVSKNEKLDMIRLRARQIET
jgi:hypothetical protein